MKPDEGNHYFEVTITYDDMDREKNPESFQRCMNIALEELFAAARKKLGNALHQYDLCFWAPRYDSILSTVNLRLSCKRRPK